MCEYQIGADRQEQDRRDCPATFVYCRYVLEYPSDRVGRESDYCFGYDDRYCSVDSVNSREHDHRAASDRGRHNPSEEQSGGGRTECHREEKTENSCAPDHYRFDPRLKPRGYGISPDMVGALLFYLLRFYIFKG